MADRQDTVAATMMLDVADTLADVYVGDGSGCFFISTTCVHAKLVLPTPTQSPRRCVYTLRKHADAVSRMLVCRIDLLVRTGGVQFCIAVGEPHDVVEALRLMLLLSEHRADAASNDYEALRRLPTPRVALPETPSESSISPAFTPRSISRKVKRRLFYHDDDTKTRSPPKTPLDRGEVIVG